MKQRYSPAVMASAVYEGVLVILALLVLWLLTIPDEPWTDSANLGIWAVFLVDYVVRLALAKNRRAFIKTHVPDLLAILPLDLFTGDPNFALGRLLRLGRLARLARLWRAGIVLWRASSRLMAIMNTNGISYVLLTAVALVIVGGIGLYVMEPDIGSVGDGIWWGVVTATTVGYGDISPKTGIGRLIATALMIVGIGITSLITGTVAGFFIQNQKNPNPHVGHIIEQLRRWDDLAPEDRRLLAVMLGVLAEEGDTKASKEQDHYRID